MVLVSNNPYAFERPPVRGARPVLDGGQLGIVVIDAPAGPPQHAGLAWSAQSLRVEASQRAGPGRSRRRGGRPHPAPPFHAPPETLRVRIAPGRVRQRGLPAHEPAA